MNGGAAGVVTRLDAQRRLVLNQDQRCGTRRKRGSPGPRTDLVASVHFPEKSGLGWAWEGNCPGTNATAAASRTQRVIRPPSRALSHGRPRTAEAGFGTAFASCPFQEDDCGLRNPHALRYRCRCSVARACRLGLHEPAPAREPARTLWTRVPNEPFRLSARHVPMLFWGSAPSASAVSIYISSLRIKPMRLPANGVAFNRALSMTLPAPWPKPISSSRRS